MVVAGIDASTTATGVSIMMDGKLIHHELIAIDSKKEKDAYKRIKEMLIRICAILDKYQIDKVYMEKAICKGGNVDITIKLAYLSGGMSLYCIQKDIEFSRSKQKTAGYDVGCYRCGRKLHKAWRKQHQTAP